MNSARKWSSVICLVIGLQLVKTQYPMLPMPAPPMYLGPMPVGGMAFPISPIRLPKCKGKAKCHTTTTKKPCSEESSEELPPVPSIPFPMPLPMAMQILLPAPLPLSTPPPSSCESSEESKRKVSRPKCPPCRCKPSCTPASFSYCSPCHERCKCRTKHKYYYSDLRSENGIGPHPLRMPPSQKAEIPFTSNEPMHPNIERKFRRDYSDESSSYYSLSSESSYPIKRKRIRNTRRNINHKRYYRRHNDVSEENEIGDSKFVRPVLSYISRNGNIKLEKRLSSGEAAQLLGDKAFQTVNIMAEEDSDKKSRIIVRSNDKQKVVASDQRRQVVLRRGKSRHVLGEGKKELVFTPPQDKKISNLTVSFQIT